MEAEMQDTKSYLESGHNKGGQPPTVQKKRAERRRDSSAPSLVYFALCAKENAVKIGVSINPQSRISELNTASPNPITLIGTCSGGVTLERRLHKRFHEWHINREWFSYSPQVIEFIEENCE